MTIEFREANSPITVSFHIKDFERLQELNQKCEEMNRSWDELVNLSIERLLNDINVVRALRK